MSVALQTIYPNQLYQLRVVGQDADVEVIRYTYATGLITSGYLPSTAVAILQTRWNLLTSGLLAVEKNMFAALLGNLIHVSDPSGVAIFYYGSSGGVANVIYATGLLSSSTYSFAVGIPNSIEMWLTGGSATVAPS
jgi:hypothetical protein